MARGEWGREPRVAVGIVVARVQPEIRSDSLRDAVDGDPRAEDALFPASRRTTKAALRHTLGAALYFDLSLRQRGDLREKLDTLNAWRPYRRAAGIRRGGIELGMEKFCQATSAVVGRRVARRTLPRWLRRVADGGVAALVDRRGRPTRGVAVDTCLFFELLALVRRGVTLHDAHDRVQRRAWREGRSWLSLRTLRWRLASGEVELQTRQQGSRRYLLRQIGRNYGATRMPTAAPERSAQPGPQAGPRGHLAGREFLRKKPVEQLREVTQEGRRAQEEELRRSLPEPPKPKVRIVAGAAAGEVERARKQAQRAAWKRTAEGLQHGLSKFDLLSCLLRDSEEETTPPAYQVDLLKDFGHAG